MNKACMKLSDAIWTITYNINHDNTATIINFDREDNDGYMFFDSLDKLESITESEGRIAESITVNGVTYDVANKANIFTYKLPL